MEPDQESLWWLFGPLIAAYLATCGGWLLAHRLRPGWWPQRPALRTDHKWRDLAMVFVAAVLVLGLGQMWRAGWLLPEPSGWMGDVAWQVNNLIIYAPVFLILAHRGQSSDTVYLSAKGLPVKLAAGLVFGLLGVAVFLALRGELDSLPSVALGTVRPENLRNFLPVFLEGVVLAFAYVRLRWAVGPWPALMAPGLLFAAAHIPRQIESGLGVPEMAAYFVVTAGVAVAVLYTLQRSRDVIWLGVVHYLMDIAIGAF
jgi:hypothetical protein